LAAPKDSSRFAFKCAHLLGWLSAAVILIVGGRIVFPLLSEPACTLLLAGSAGEVEVPLPNHCSETDNIHPDNMVRYLENDRDERNLVFKKWIVCDPPMRAPGTQFAFESDPRWLPSYIPLTYQFRRTVVVLPYARPIPQGSRVVGEVCLMPWRKYASLIAGQCNGKFSVWK
jgi:hypothetical protein